MRAQASDLPVLFEAGPSSLRGVDCDGMRIAVVSVPAGTDFGPLLEGLPNDRCQAAHWGYVIKGRLNVTHPGGSEILQAGDVYHLPPGHTGIAEEDSEFLEISDPSEHDRFIANAARVVAGMAAG